MNSESVSSPQVAAAGWAAGPAAGRLSRWLAWLGLLVTVGLATAVRLRVAAAPLERDEGEYAYNAQLLLRHEPPYRYAYNMKFPGVYGMYALILGALGQTPTAIRAGVAIVNDLDILLVFLLARRLWGERCGAAAVAAATTFAAMSLDQHALGWAGHAEHFMLLPALAGLLLLVPAIEPLRTSASTRRGGLSAWRWIAAALLLGVAVLMKQPAAAFVVLGAGLAAMSWAQATPGRGRRWMMVVKLMLFLVAAAVPTVVVGLLLWWAGVFGRFWFWTVDYARSYGAQVPMRAMPIVLLSAMRGVARWSWPLWCLAGAGMVAACWRMWRGRGRSVIVLLGIVGFSFLATAAGGLFRHHYFILLMPAAGLGVGALFAGEGRGFEPQARWRNAMVVVFLVAIGWFIAGEWRFLFVMTPVQISRDTYPAEAFIEAVDVGQYLRLHTSAADRIAVLGSEPEIYFYARRLSATGYIYTYPLLEPQPYALAMQQQMARQIESARPLYVVWVRVDNSWSQVQDVSPPRFIFDWWRAYSQQYVPVAGETVGLPLGQQRLESAATAARMAIGSRPALLIYRRKSAAGG